MYIQLSAHHWSRLQRDAVLWVARRLAKLRGAGPLQCGARASANDAAHRPRNFGTSFQTECGTGSSMAEQIEVSQYLEAMAEGNEPLHYVSVAQVIEDLEIVPRTQAKATPAKAKPAKRKPTNPKPAKPNPAKTKPAKSKQAIPWNQPHCIICNRNVRTMRNAYRHYSQGTSTLKAVLKNYAQRRNDKQILQRLNQPGPFWHHMYCYTKYSNDTSEFIGAGDDNNNDDRHAVSGLHKIAYSAIRDLVLNEIIGEEKSITLHELQIQYKTILLTLNTVSGDEMLRLDEYTEYNLQSKLLKDFGKYIAIKNFGKVKGLVYKIGVADAPANMLETNVVWTCNQIKQSFGDKMPNS